MVHRRKPKSPINLSSIDQVTEMNNSVDHGCSKLLVSNDLPLFAERKVCRQYQTLVLIHHFVKPKYKISRCIHIYVVFIER